MPQTLEQARLTPVPARTERAAADLLERLRRFSVAFDLLGVNETFRRIMATLANDTR